VSRYGGIIRPDILVRAAVAADGVVGVSDWPSAEVTANIIGQLLLDRP
jgi:hypothetical protein